MKKILVIILIITVPVLITGCFQLKEISYTDEDSIGINMNTDSAGASEKEDSKAGSFKFFAGKISYQDDSVLVSDTPKTDEATPRVTNTHSERNSTIVLKTSFKSLEEFDAYIQEIKRQSDVIAEVTDNPMCSIDQMKEAIKKSEALLDITRKIDIPENIIRTERGRYYAGKYAVDELESLVVFRIELFEKYSKKLKKTSKSLEYEIESLEDGAIPIKESGFEISRRSMMEEEGYVWDKQLRKFTAEQ